MKKVIVVGGGAAGMMAAIVAARGGSDVTLLEKNEKLGKKIYITGKGRCNVTNACDTDQLFRNVVSNSKFLYSSFHTFSNTDVISFFEELGCRLKVERGNRVFPVSDKSSDIIGALKRECKQQGVSVIYNSLVESVLVDGGQCKGVKAGKNEAYADAVIVATGGLSYPSTGSTGDGYRFAKQAGHTLTELLPSLVPLETVESDPAKMQGLSLKNIEISFLLNDKKEIESASKPTLIYKEFGEMIFTHFGISGPVVISGSSYCANYLKSGDVMVHIDLKPALSEEELDLRIRKDFESMKNVQFKNSLAKLLPKTMIPIMIERSKIEPDRQVNTITKEERKYLLHCIKKLSFSIKGPRGYQEAIVTKGGISIREINPSTMESKVVKNLYFAGEILDLDALTGGFNLQIAWSTGYLAGIHV